MFSFIKYALSEKAKLKRDLITIYDRDFTIPEYTPNGLIFMDILNNRQASPWSIDLHYPKKQYAGKFPDNPFISVAVHGKGADRSYGYPVPYRCFYSRNIDNLFMAGRCISVTHEALGAVRVMKTCGMMGEIVGMAAAICKRHDCEPRDVYASYLEELKEQLRQGTEK